MDNGSFWGALLGLFSVAVVMGLAIGLPILLIAVVAGLNHVLTLAVGASLDAIRARYRARRHT